MRQVCREESCTSTLWTVWANVNSLCILMCELKSKVQKLATMFYKVVIICVTYMQYSRAVFWQECGDMIGITIQGLWLKILQYIVIFNHPILGKLLYKEHMTTCIKCELKKFVFLCNQNSELSAFVFITVTDIRVKWLKTHYNSATEELQV